MESLVRNANSNTLWQGISQHFLEIRKSHESNHLKFSGVVACISPVRSANTNFVMVVTNHSKWVPNVASQIIVQN